MVDLRLGLLEPIEVLLEEDEAVGRLSDQIVFAGDKVLCTDAERVLKSLLLHVTENFEAATEVTLLDLVLAILVVLVR